MRRAALFADVRQRCATALLAGAALGCALGLGSAAAQARGKPRHRDPVTFVKKFERTHPKSVQLVGFKHQKWGPVRVVRGGGWTAKKVPRRPVEETHTAQIVRFPVPDEAPVAVLRGASPRAAAASPAADRQAFQRVVFADPHFAPVTVIRGPSRASAAVLSAAFEPFGPASADDLDRIAFAVDGVESSHGANPAMWRPDFGGPQGPMQVSLAAASDVGGGDRFDLAQNRVLGRAYLARLFQRYGNWPDTLAAYNWGPGHVDAWISQGRPPAALPLETERYVARVMRDAGLANRISLPAIPASR